MLNWTSALTIVKTAIMLMSIYTCTSFHKTTIKCYGLFFKKLLFTECCTCDHETIILIVVLTAIELCVSGGIDWVYYFLWHWNVSPALPWFPPWRCCFSDWWISRGVVLRSSVCSVCPVDCTGYCCCLGVQGWSPPACPSLKDKTIPFSSINSSTK